MTKGPSSSPLPDKLRVLMLAPTPYFSDRGCHVRIYEEARSLQQLGHQVCIVTYHLGRDMPGIPVVRIPPVPWYGKLEAGPSWHKPYLDLLLLLKAYSVARSFRPHVLHAHLHEGVLVGSILRRMLGIPLLFDYQGSLSGEALHHGFFRNQSLLHKAFQFLERLLDTAADAVIASSSQGRDELVNDWKLPSDQVDTLLDGVDTEVFKPYEQAESRHLLEIPLDIPLVVYLGLFNSYQGLDLLLEAIPLVRARISGIRFLLMGFPHEGYRRKAVEMGIDDCIIFTGRISYDQAPSMLSAGDLAVSPKLARTEANGKLFNYMACGLPVVAFEGAINREILGDDGIYADFGDSASLAACIVRAMEDAQWRNDLGRRARKRAVDMHSWVVRGQQLVDTYRRLLANRLRQ